MAMASKIRYCVSPFASLGQKDWKKFAERSSNWSYAGRIFVWGGAALAVHCRDRPVHFNTAINSQQIWQEKSS